MGNFKLKDINKTNVLPLESNYGNIYRVSGINTCSLDFTVAPNLRKILDDMEQHFNGKDAKFSDYEFNKLLNCMNKDDDILVKAQDSIWKKGFIDYYHNGGRKGDKWGNCGSNFIEWKWGSKKSSKFGEIDIYEPCNYVSNVAYYRAATRICEY